MCKKFILPLLSLFLLQACSPIIFGAIGGAVIWTTVEVSKDKSIGDSFNDISIKARISKAISKSSYKSISSRVNLEVTNGRVLATGILSNQDEIVEVLNIIWRQEGVKEVDNEIKIQANDEASISQFVKDSWITSQIKTKTFFTKKIKFVNYTIVTLNSVVYVFGNSVNKQELDRVLEIASEISGVKEVINYVYYSNNSKRNLDIKFK